MEHLILDFHRIILFSPTVKTDILLRSGFVRLNLVGLSLLLGLYGCSATPPLMHQSQAAAIASTSTPFTTPYSRDKLLTTNNPLDLMIDNFHTPDVYSFFMLKSPIDGSIVYSRGSSFSVDKNGYLKTDNGFMLVPELAIPTDADTVRVTSDGRILYGNDNSLELTEAGKLTLARFRDATGLRPLGHGIYAATPASGGPEVLPPIFESMGEIYSGVAER